MLLLDPKITREFFGYILEILLYVETFNWAISPYLVGISSAAEKEAVKPVEDKKDATPIVKDEAPVVKDEAPLVKDDTPLVKDEAPVEEKEDEEDETPVEEQEDETTLADVEDELAGTKYSITHFSSCKQLDFASQPESCLTLIIKINNLYPPSYKDFFKSLPMK